MKGVCLAGWYFCLVCLSSYRDEPFHFVMYLDMAAILDIGNDSSSSFING